jgi:hypothetical protein
VTRATMRQILRRRLDDPEDDANDGAFFSNAELDEALNLGANRLQRLISIVDPAAFLNISEQNLEADTWRYPKPTGSWSILDVRMLNEDGNEYVSLGDPLDIWQLDKVARSSGTTRFGFFGRFIRLAPTPDTSVTDGLQWWYVKSNAIATGTANDADSYEFHAGLANLHILLTQEVLIPEQTSDGAEELRKLIAAEAESIPLYYRRTLGPEVGFSIANLEKPGSGVMVPNGVPFGSSWS